MLFINAKIITMAGQDIESGYIEVRDGIIAALGEMSRVPSRFEGGVYDCAGNSVYPGFIDAHCHLGMFPDGHGVEAEDANEDTDPCTPHLRAIDACYTFDSCFEKALEWGITTVVTGPGSTNPVAGQLCAIKTYGRCIDDMAIMSPAGIKFALGENPKSSYRLRSLSPVTRMAVAAIIREQLQKSQKYMEQTESAADGGCADEPEFDAKCEALIPLLKREIKAYFHVHRADDIFTAIRISKEFNLDYVLVHCTEGHLICKELAELGCKVIVGPVIASKLKSELRNASTVTPGVLASCGVKTAICTDHPEVPVEYLTTSAAIAVRDGMEYRDALEAITINAARICGISNRVGSIETGKDADLLIYDCDPLVLTAKPLAVFTGNNFTGEPPETSSRHHINFTKAEEK